MIDLEENISLHPFNTFGIDIRAKYFVRITSKEDFQKLINTSIYKLHSSLILGGGSNVLFTKDYNGLVIKDDLKGIAIVDETPQLITIKVQAGENWHQFVMYCVKNNYGGVENLSLIPGTMGAAPMQNIGAYGIEVKEVIKEVEAIDRNNGSVRVFSNEDCRFGYRESVFKQALREKFFISSVTLTLTKNNHHLNTSYGAIQDTLKQMNVIQPTIQSVSNAVIHIRQSKLPDPLVIGNAGSFFKNPSISLHQYEELKKMHPNIPGYISENQLVKVPAGWLIEQCDWKGKRINNVGVHSQQALVLVNYGNAKGEELFQLAQRIQSSVKEKFDIDLTTEVNII
jgi:UDP-N-acetylmuramate dehydrogenase